MRYAVRFILIFAFILLASRVSAGILIGNHWYFFFWATFVGLLNAGIRTFYKAFSTSSSWPKVIIGAIVLNWLLFSLIYWGAFTWLEISSPTYGPVLLGALVVIIPSSICNHFIRVRRR